LHRNAQPKNGGGPATDCDVIARGLDVCGQDSEEKNKKAKSGERACLREQNANGSENFADSREINQGHGIGKYRRHHASKVVAHFIEMRSAGEEEHCGQCNAGGGHPRVEDGEAEGAESPENEKRNDQDEKD
jgi:hypothetical protein